MPSDARFAPALLALRGPIDAFRSAVTAARAQVSDHLDAHRAPVMGREALAAAGLGHFAAGRLDAARFAQLFGGARVLAPEDVLRLERCRAALDAIAEAGDKPFALHLPDGAAPEAAVAGALANLGRAFGALLAFQAVKTGTYREDWHGAMLEGIPFDGWNRAERLLAPPLVLSVAGADVDASRLAGFLDGRVRLVLLVRGPMAPAALVSLVTPGVLVAQSDDAAVVSRLAASAGPAVVAVTGAEAARFTHDPAGGARLCDRLAVERLPQEAPRAALGRRSAAQQAEQLAQLGALAAAAGAEAMQGAERAMEATQAAAAMAATTADDRAVDALAGWLLQQAGMAGEAAR